MRPLQLLCTNHEATAHIIIVLQFLWYLLMQYYRPIDWKEIDLKNKHFKTVCRNPQKFMTNNPLILVHNFIHHAYFITLLRLFRHTQHLHNGKRFVVGFMSNVDPTRTFESDFLATFLTTASNMLVSVTIESSERKSDIVVPMNNFTKNWWLSSKFGSDFKWLFQSSQGCTHWSDWWRNCLCLAIGTEFSWWKLRRVFGLPLHETQTW